MSSLSGNGSIKFTNIPATDLHTQPVGMLCVAVEHAARLQNTGLPCRIQFGILTTNGQIIVQQCTVEDLHNPQFKIKKVALEAFCPTLWSLYVPENATELYNLKQAHRKALQELGTLHQYLRSYPGDDFTAECLFGERSVLEYIRTGNTGQHWWTPLYYKIDEIQQELTSAIKSYTRIKLPTFKTPDKMNVELLHFKHHGITIEDNWVIHFARCRVPDYSNRIKLDTLQTFCDITPNTEPGAACEYKNETEQKRLQHRNRAVWHLFHAEQLGSYNFLWNNCEHFSRLCKVGKKQSAQVKNGIVDTALAVLPYLIPVGGILAKIIASLGLPIVKEKLKLNA